MRTFVLKNLTFFHIVLLANIAHKECPLYSLFKNQCYWFANIIYEGARCIDNSQTLQLDLPGVTTESSSLSRPLMDLIYVPFQKYMPETAGRWYGIQISVVEPIVLSSIVSKFNKELEDHRKQVFYTCFYY
jgi:hypothetical protein